MAFGATLDLFDTRRGELSGIGGAGANIAKTDRPFGGYFGPPQSDAAGTVIFKASLTSGGDGVFLASEGTITTVAVTGGFFSGGFANAVIYGSGEAVFSAGTQIGNGIFSGSAGPITTIIDNSGSSQSFGNTLSARRGRVASLDRLDAGGEGIYRSEGGLLFAAAHTTAGNIRSGAITLNEAFPV